MIKLAYSLIDEYVNERTVLNLSVHLLYQYTTYKYTNFYNNDSKLHQNCRYTEQLNMFVPSHTKINANNMFVFFIQCNILHLEYIKYSEEEKLQTLENVFLTQNLP